MLLTVQSLDRSVVSWGPIPVLLYPSHSLASRNTLSHPPSARIKITTNVLVSHRLSTSNAWLLKLLLL